MLYPQTNSKRLAIRLDGVWRFRKDPHDRGRDEEWAANAPQATIPMPVPSAFNEMTSDPELRDYFGAVWYFHEFDAPPCGERHVLRFGAAVHHAEVWLNGRSAGTEHLGKLPFEINVSGLLRPSGNRLAVRIDTRLTWQTIPPGDVQPPRRPWGAPDVHGPENSPRAEYHFDFLNYGGLLRSVWLLALPASHIETIRVETLAERDTPRGLKVRVGVHGQGAPTAGLRLLDATGACVAACADGESLLPAEPHAWSPEDPYLYTLEITLGETDRYTLQVGLRTVRITPEGMLLNGRPVYLKGFGLHEDFHLVGHGHSDARMVKDLTLLKEMGANSFRTSHYPYDEAVYQLADRLGLLVIAETAAVGLNTWGAGETFCEERCNAGTLASHRRALERMIERDHWHPCVVMWSLANEPACNEPGAVDYFRELFACCRAADPQGLPVTVVLCSTPPGSVFPASHHSRIAGFCDAILWNRYYAWYDNHGRLVDIGPQLECEARAWREAFPDKPVMIAEFGADAVAGMHSDPPVGFSEEYQLETIRRYVETLDTLPWVMGEHVWNLCDFMTKQGLTRVIGNRKGVHTRERQPKLAAHFLKQRWCSPLDRFNRPRPERQ